MDSAFLLAPTRSCFELPENRTAYLFDHYFRKNVMSRTTAKPLVLLFLLGLAVPARAEYGFSSLISPDEAHRFGLDRMWFTQAQLDVARGHITEIQQFISSTEGYTVHEVQYQGKTKAFSERDVDAFGKVVGVDEAKKLAEEFLEEVKVREIFGKLQLPVGVEAQARRLYTVFKDRKSSLPEDLTAEEQKAVLAKAQKEFTDGMIAILTPEQNAKFQQLQTQGSEAKLQTLKIPEITLYVTTDRGVIHAIDAETGRTRWAVVVGRRDFPTERAGVSEDWVAVLNGSDLYLLKRATGEVAWKRRVQGVPSAGPAITDTYVVVPTYGGQVELYDLVETRTLPEIYWSNGRILVQPIVTPLSVAWPTDRGFLYVARASKKGIRYRLEARNTITSQPSYAPGRFFTSSIDGDVYCVHETSGEEFWRFTTGEPISNTPVPVGDKLYVVTDKGNLFCLKQETGEELWWTVRIKRFVSASKDRLYCLGHADRLVILDAKTGGRIASMKTQLLDIFYPNLQTDRIFVATKSGVIQCLRETQMRWPLVHAGLAEAKKKQRPEIKQEGLGEGPAKPAPKKPVPPAVNPFGGANPFGGGGAGAGGQPNPFGGGGAGAGGQPNGGAGAKPDPFGGGGGASPFN